MTSKQPVGMLNALKSSKIYDLEFERFREMPTLRNVQPFFYGLWRRHEDTYDPAQGPRTTAAGILVAADHTGTHIDALCHQSENLELFGGIPVNESTETPWGFAKLGSETIPPLVKRGILLDVAEYKGVPQLPERYEVTIDDLKGTSELEDVRPSQDDVVLVRTGYGKSWDDPTKFLKFAGVAKECSIWLSELKVTAVGADNLSWELLEVPVTGSGLFGHLYLIARHGIYILENLNLEGLSADRCYEFVFVALPLKYRGATASPVRPIAISAGK